MISRRILLGFPLAGMLRVAPAIGQTKRREDPLFTFRDSFWLNLHHFLYVLGRAQNKAPDAARPAVAGAVTDTAGFADATESEQNIWRRSIATYSATFSTKDLVFDRHLARVTAVFGDTEDGADALSAEVDADVRDALLAAAPIYRKVWWQRHSGTNRARTRDLEALVSQYGKTIAAEMARLYQTTWPASGFRIDVSAYVHWAGSYSTNVGLIAWSSMDPTMAGTQGLEILFHEAAHQWDGPTQTRILEIARKAQLRFPQSFSHSLIFYTAGYVVSKVVPGHRPYAVENGLWTGNGFVDKEKLDEFWLPYLEGKAGFDEAIEQLLKALA